MWDQLTQSSSRVMLDTLILAGLAARQKQDTTALEWYVPVPGLLRLLIRAGFDSGSETRVFGLQKIRRVLFSVLYDIVLVTAVQ